MYTFIEKKSRDVLFSFFFFYFILFRKKGEREFLLFKILVYVLLFSKV